MRAYHFMSESAGLEALARQRLRLATFNDMNDPFELLGVALRSKQDREAFQELKKDMDRTIGALCFSRHWGNPILWSHYADKHRGICLGFDIPTKWALPVKYRGTRIKDEIQSNLPKESRKTLGYKLLTTKYEHWRYEDEVRLILRFEDVIRDGSSHYLPFCDSLRLRTLILGTRNPLTIERLTIALPKAPSRVTIIKGRLAFHSFKVVKNRADRWKTTSK